MRIFIATSDSSSYILKPFAWLMDKYLPEFDEIIILGYGNFPELPPRYRCVSLVPKQDNISEWSSRLYDYFTNIDDKYIIFGLDDFFPVRKVDYRVFNPTFEYMKYNKCVRYELGKGHSWHKKVKRINRSIYEYGQDSLYRISTQFSVWDREYMLKHLYARADPFDFELEGSKRAADDGERIIATNTPTAWEWVEAGAISSRHPGMVNILGMNELDILEMIDLGLFKKELLQYGMAIGDNEKYTLRHG